MSKSLDALKDEVRQNRDAVNSAVALINGIADRIEKASQGVDDSGELDALTADLRQQASDLASAVAANTPAATGPGVSTVDQSGANNSAAGQPVTGASDSTDQQAPSDGS